MDTNAIKSLMLTEAECISDPLDRAEAVASIELYVSALGKYHELTEGGSIQSYTIAGRTITRNNIGDAQRQLEQLRKRAYSHIRGSITYIDMGGYA